MKVGKECGDNDIVGQRINSLDNLNRVDQSVEQVQVNSTSGNFVPKSWWFVVWNNNCALIVDIEILNILWLHVYDFCERLVAGDIAKLC